MRQGHDDKREDGVWTWSRGEACAAASVPAVGMLRSRPKVGVDAALCEVTEDREEELSARARGAKGGGLPETGGLKGRLWERERSFVRSQP